MNPFQMEWQCDVCGERGMVRANDIALMFRPGYSSAHNDPRICRDVLKRRADAMKALAAASIEPAASGKPDEARDE